MKKIHFYSIAIAAVFFAVGCGGRQANTAADGETEQQSEHTHTHKHPDGTECSGDHREVKTHSHGDCDHDHSGHDHDAHAGHDHSGHVHADGEACGGHEGHSHAGHSHGRGGDEGDEIVFPASQAAKTDFEVQAVRRAPFTEVIKTSGRIMPAQGAEVSVVAPVSGIVSFAGAGLSDGAPVRASQRLFYISSGGVASGDIFARTEAAYRKALSDYERAAALLEDNIVSRREYEELESVYLQAKAEYEAIAGTRSEKGAAVSASISGYVTGLNVSEGEYVEVGQPLATVTQNRRLVLRAEVSQKYYGVLRNLRTANFTVPYDNTNYSLEDMGGKLLSVGRAASQGSSLIPVSFEFNNNGEVYPGAYVEVYLLGAPVPDAIAVPVTALTEQQGLYYVYLQLDEEHYEKREVWPGPSDGKTVRIISGLHPGERVVTRGAVNVKMAAASGDIPHGHEH